MFESKTKLPRAVLAVALATVGLAGVTTAEARDRYRDRGDDAAIAIGAGIVGLAIGALLADRDDRYYNDRRYYSQRRYVRVRGYPDYYYYYPNNPRRYYRDRHYSRNYGAYYSGRSYDRRYYNRYDRRWRDDYSGRDYRYRDRNYRYRDRDYRYRDRDYGYRGGY